MKQLSIEEKAARYDKAIEIAKSNYDAIVQMDNDCTFVKEGIINTFHHIFPELKESEDERIRKNLLGYIKGVNEREVCKETLNEWIAWLEKQGEKDEEILILKDQIESLHAAIKAIKETHRIELEKQGEQKPAWSEEDERRYIGLHNLIYSTQYCDSRKELSDWLKSLKYRYTWKPSEGQMEALKGVVQEGVFRFGILESLYQDLKKLKVE